MNLINVKYNLLFKNDFVLFCLIINKNQTLYRHNWKNCIKKQQVQWTNSLLTEFYTLLIKISTPVCQHFQFFLNFNFSKLLFFFSDLSQELRQLSVDGRQLPATAHALKVSSACALNSYHVLFVLFLFQLFLIDCMVFFDLKQFFKLHQSAPNMSAFIMDYMVPLFRKVCIENSKRK